MQLSPEQKLEVKKRIARSAAFQNLFRGGESELVLDEIMKFCSYKNDTFESDPYEHAYAAGRRSAAVFIQNCINQNVKEAEEALKNA